MKLTADEAASVVYGESEAWEPVKETTQLTGHGRWSVHKTAVFKHIESGAFYRFNWSVGATENQDQEPFYRDYEPIEVELREITRQEWLPKNLEV